MPKSRSEVGLLNSAASMRPDFMAGWISPPGSCTTDMPISKSTSAARPTVRYYRPLICDASVISSLNQPRGCAGIGELKKDSTFRPSSPMSSSKSS